MVGVWVSKSGLVGLWSSADHYCGSIIPSRRLFCFAGPASTKAGRARVWRRSPRRTASLPKARAFARFHACAHSPLEFEDQVATSPPTAHRPASDHHAHRRVTIDSVPRQQSTYIPSLPQACSTDPAHFLSLPVRLPSLGAAPRPHLPPAPLLHLPAPWTPTIAARSLSAQVPSTLVPVLR